MYSVKEQILVMQSVKEQILVDLNFTHAQCQEDYTVARSRFCTVSRSIIRAQCQGAYFNTDAQCQGAYAGDEYIEFKNRIGKKTELKTMQFVGELDEEVIEKIEAAKNYLSDKWYQKMQRNYRGKQG